LKATAGTAVTTAGLMAASSLPRLVKSNVSPSAPPQQQQQVLQLQQQQQQQQEFSIGNNSTTSSSQQQQPTTQASSMAEVGYLCKSVDAKERHVELRICGFLLYIPFTPRAKVSPISPKFSAKLRLPEKNEKMFLHLFLFSHTLKFS
jgi:hypothetical protein